ncbi:hypothetical protein ONS95_013705 [Cadophora gregata]|uniref:uncharacterized protein n=1 Tax=Cadophora gregata TaxID=51156 RepID=UPI0026DA734F|nr:uncharacterized protein ONS95_013705 [Cadophora gregata]KAK0113447.1 hypothetical protein ONS96_014313 [Cadophora gregata f. sp. sojae]KAK0114205.1 hypothetical protein ONS95_013705 [Cadophora gregata]
MPVFKFPFSLEIDRRLSGILPFVASYVSATPTRNTLYLGEDRNSVLGAHRVPGQKKWSTEIPRVKSNFPDERFDDPKIRFVPSKGMLVNSDDEHKDHVSYIVVIDRRGFELTTIMSDPAMRHREMVERDQREEKEAEARLAEKTEVERLSRERWGVK